MTTAVVSSGIQVKTEKNITTSQNVPPNNRSDVLQVYCNMFIANQKCERAGMFSLATGLSRTNRCLPCSFREFLQSEDTLIFANLEANFDPLITED